MSPGGYSPPRFGNGVIEGPAVASRWLGDYGCHSKQPSGYKLQGPINEACSVSLCMKSAGYLIMKHSYPLWLHHSPWLMERNISLWVLVEWCMYLFFRPPQTQTAPKRLPKLSRTQHHIYTQPYPLHTAPLPVNLSTAAGPASNPSRSLDSKEISTMLRSEPLQQSVSHSKHAPRIFIVLQLLS